MPVPHYKEQHWDTVCLYCVEKAGAADDRQPTQWILQRNEPSSCSCKETSTDGYTAVQEGFNQAQCKLLKIPSLKRVINLSSEGIISQNIVSVLFRDPKPENDLHIGESQWYSNPAPAQRIPSQNPQKSCFAQKRDPAEVAVWTCVALYGATASVEKTKCNCWH